MAKEPLANFYSAKPTGICEMCGHHVGVRQKAHIMAEGRKTESNVLMLCPTCHIMFDTHLKPKIFKAMIEAGLKGFPKSWKKSIYEQAAEASAMALRNKKEEGGTESGEHPHLTCASLTSAPDPAKGPLPGGPPPRWDLLGTFSRLVWL